MEITESQCHGGHHLPVVQVYVDGNTTYKHLKELLLCPSAVEHLEYQYFKTEGHFEAYRKAVEEWFSTPEIMSKETEEERLEKKREYHRKWYSDNKERILVENRAKYKEKRGRPKLRETKAEKTLKQKKLANKVIVRDMPTDLGYGETKETKRIRCEQAIEDQRLRNQEYFKDED